VRLLLDTSALLVLCRAEAGFETLRDTVSDLNHEIFIASISLAELGRRVRELGADESVVNTLLGYCKSIATTVVIDGAIAELSLRLAKHATARIPLADSLIAACAVSMHATLIHRDKHFESMQSSVLPQLTLPLDSRL